LQSFNENPFFFWLQHGCNRIIQNKPDKVPKKLSEELSPSSLLPCFEIKSDPGALKLIKKTMD